MFYSNSNLINYITTSLISYTHKPLFELQYSGGMK